MSDFERSKSLQELEGHDWGEPNVGSSVVTNSYRLGRLPLRDFTLEDLRFMIGQQIGLQYLIPIALGHLRSNPLVEGDCYSGDLLAAVLRADSRFWLASPELRAETARVAERAISLLPTLDEYERQTTEDSLRDAHNVFQRADYFADHGRA